MARKPKPAKLVTNPQLRCYVQDRLAGKIHDADSREITGLQEVTFKGRSKPHRGDRQWINGWSPEAIYQALYIQG